jgi:CBS domain containing-hemolysin-like protein
MLQSVFMLSQTTVKEIAVPLIHVTSISIDSSVYDARTLFSRSRFSRLPVYEKTHDNLIGILYIKDLLLIPHHENTPLRSLLRPILFAPETIKVNQLLHEFKENRLHMAAIIDEYGTTVGLATLEDALEEIVGEINDENEQGITEKIIPLKQGGWLVDGVVGLQEIGKILHISFETEHAQTIGGFLTEQLHHLPIQGETLTYKGYTFHVQNASTKRVYELLIVEAKNSVVHKNIDAQRPLPLG